MDIGTLFHAKKILNARAIPASPMKDINASEDLLLKYSDALVLTAFDRYKKARNMEITDRKASSKNRALMDKIITELVEEYIIPEIAWLHYLFHLNKGDFVYQKFYKNKIGSVH